mmetsp:Transcript_24803/g.52710  ORF Transcript_24803/g.52710 Transcript_24803/m.52710 type:complete len:260 (-) Transcript_24803:271-1050(-)
MLAICVPSLLQPLSAVLPLVRSHIGSRRTIVRLQEAEEAFQQTPFEVTPGNEEGVPMDQEAVDRDFAAYQRQPASPQELASHLPSWAASFMLDDVAQQKYERELAFSAAREFSAVEGRSWEGLEYDDDAGLPAFTASEIADDYSIPVETVLTRMGQLGVDIETHSVSKPVKEYCSESQIQELLSFVALTDPIAAREALSDATVFELSVDGGGDCPLSSDALVQLCKQHDIPLVLGVDTRLDRTDHEALVALAEREAAFL